MKKALSLSAIILLAVMPLSAQQEKDIKPEIKHITVFPDRAQIDQEASVALSQGRLKLNLKGLSPYIDVQSIHVGGQGDFTILSVSHRNNYIENLDELPEIKSVQNQIDALLAKAEDEKAAIAVLNQKQSFLEANKAILVKETTFSLEQVRGMMDLYTSNIEQVTTTVLKKNRLLKDYAEQISILQKQISDKTERQQLPSGQITVELEAARAMTAKISLSYIVMNAGWYPSYDIRVNDIRNPVSIVYKANIFQNTGVEWKDVKLSVSNASTWITGDVPNLYTWFLDFYNPQPVYRKFSRSVDKEKAEEPVALAEVVVTNADAVMAPAPPPVEKKTGETAVSFDIALPYTVASDGKIQTVEIQNTTTPAEYKYVAIPKLSPRAYLTANITDWAAMNLQTGEATLYFENSFVGKSSLNVNEMSDTLTLSLGTDNGILVRREKRKDFSSRKVIGANKTDTYSYLINVRNNKQVAARITLFDQVPVSTNSSIDVQAVELSGGKINRETGEVRWDLDLKPQEAKQLILTYSAKYPREKIVNME